MKNGKKEWIELKELPNKEKIELLNFMKTYENRFIQELNLNNMFTDQQIKEALKESHEDYIKVLEKKVFPNPLKMIIIRGYMKFVMSNKK